MERKYNLFSLQLLLGVLMCLCVCVCVYECACACVCMCVCVCGGVGVCVCVCVSEGDQLVEPSTVGLGLFSDYTFYSTGQTKTWIILSQVHARNSHKYIISERNRNLS